MMKHCCEKMDAFLDDERIPLIYSAKFREYFIELQERNVVQEIYYCPWCGKKLPGSLREEWFTTLEENLNDFDGFNDPRIPIEFQTDEWWKKQNL